jgi:hypothetical protein
MALGPVGTLAGVEHAARGAGESNPFTRARHHRDQPASERSLSQIHGVIRAPCPEIPNGAPETQRGSVGSAFVVTNDASNVRIVRQDDRPWRGSQYIDGSALGELGDERRGKHHVTEKTRLDNERSAQSLSVVRACIPPSPPGELREMLPAVSPPIPLVSFASFPLSAFRAACAYA